MTEAILESSLLIEFIGGCLSGSHLEVLVARCVITAKNTKRTLLLRRTLSSSYSPGAWEVPGGRVEGKRRLTEGCVREVFEETGIRITEPQLICVIDDQSYDEGPFSNKRFITYLYTSEIDKALDVVLSKEHDESIWTTWIDSSELTLTLQSYKALIKIALD